MKSILKNKKAQTDGIFIMVSIFILCIVLVASIYVGNMINDKLTPFLSEQDATNVSAVALNKTITTATGSGDWIFLTGFVLSILGLIITSFLFWSHPAFIVIWILLTAGMVIGGVFLSNLFSDITSTAFTSVTASLPIMTYIMGKYPLIMAIVGVLSIIIILSKGSIGLGGNSGGQSI